MNWKSIKSDRITTTLRYLIRPVPVHLEPLFRRVEKSMERIEKRRLAEFIWLREHGYAVSDSAQTGPFSREASHIGDVDRAQSHACTSCART